MRFQRLVPLSAIVCWLNGSVWAAEPAAPRRVEIEVIKIDLMSRGEDLKPLEDWMEASDLPDLSDLERRGLLQDVERAVFTAYDGQLTEWQWISWTRPEQSSPKPAVENAAPEEQGDPLPAGVENSTPIKFPTCGVRVSATPQLLADGKIRVDIEYGLERTDYDHVSLVGTPSVGKQELQTTMVLTPGKCQFLGGGGLTKRDRDGTIEVRLNVAYIRVRSIEGPPAKAPAPSTEDRQSARPAAKNPSAMRRCRRPPGILRRG